MTTYFGFAFSAAMLPAGDVTIEKSDMQPEHVAAALREGAVSCCNPSHRATVDAAGHRFGLAISVPERPPRVALEAGDSIIVMQVTGLPRRTDQAHYSAEEIAGATFRFMRLTVT